MKNLELHEMEKFSGGNCATSAAALGLAFIGAFAIATTGGAALFLGAFVLGSINVGHACK